MIAAPEPVDLRFDVGAAVGSTGPLEQAAWVFLPPPGTAPRSTLVCLAGGTYDRHYWHLDVPGHHGYSFGSHLAARGFLVVAVDHLAVGASSDPVDLGPVGLELLAAGDAEVVRQVRERVRSGTLHPSIPPVDAPIVGVGHSMGACVALVAQAISPMFDRLVLLGHSLPEAPISASGDLGAEITRNTEIVCGLAGVAPDVTSLQLDRAPMRELFHASDVAADVVAADDHVASRVPTRAAAEAMTHSFVAGFAVRVSVPLLLAFGGDLDLSPDPSAEPAAYPEASDVTVHVLEGSRHCHNLASRRAELWEVIADWSGRALR